MKLIIGGFAQGKLAGVLSQRKQEGKNRFVILDENSADIVQMIRQDRAVSEEIAEGTVVIINHLHRIIQMTGTSGKMLDRQSQEPTKIPAPEPVRPEEQIQAWLHRLETICQERKAELVIICDELGCGVVPAVYEDRIYRENVGRIVCELAAQAECVERIVCGISCRIK